MILCHKAPEQVNLVLDTLQDEDINFFIHVDKKSSISDAIQKRNDIILVPEEKRIDVKWGQYSQVQATLNLIECACNHGSYDYFLLISGQDFPIVSPKKILEYLSADREANYVDLFKSMNNGIGYPTNYDKRNYIAFPRWIMGRKTVIRVIRRAWVALSGGYNHTYRIFMKKQPKNTHFYFGSQWWCITSGFASYIDRFLKENPEYQKFYANSSCPDESFFQTLLMNSPYADTRKEYFHYIDWSEGKSSPKNLGVEDFDDIMKSGKLFARKIDGDYLLIDKLTEQIKNCKATG